MSVPKKTKSRPKQAKPQSPTGVRPDIFGYHDYRIFLRDWIEYLRGTQKGFSTRSLAKSAAIANGYLSSVLSGARVLTPKALVKMLPHLHLSDSETGYFEALRELAESSSQEARLEALKRMQRFHSFRRESPRELEVYKYLTKWSYVAVREMAAFPGFQLNADWIRSQLLPKTSLKEVQDAIEFLTTHNFLQPTPEGGATVVDKQLDCFGGIYKLSLSEFHKQMFALATEAIDTVPRDERNILGHTLAIPEARFGELKTILDETLARIEQLGTGQEQKDRLYHVGLLAFPLARAVTSQTEKHENADEE